MQHETWCEDVRLGQADREVEDDGELVVLDHPDGGDQCTGRINAVRDADDPANSVRIWLTVTSTGVRVVVDGGGFLDRAGTLALAGELTRRAALMPV